jgi:hypothetical protein
LLPAKFAAFVDYVLPKTFNLADLSGSDRHPWTAYSRAAICPGTAIQSGTYSPDAIVESRAADSDELLH